MSSSAPAPPPERQGFYLELESDSVNVTQLLPPLLTFIDAAGRAHRGLFGIPLVVTSGNDGKHTPGSAHYKNGAVDLRSRDKSPAGQLLFSACLVFLGELYGVVVFDERATAAPHYHCELAQMVGEG